MCSSVRHLKQSISRVTTLSSLALAMFALWGHRKQTGSGNYFLLVAHHSIQMEHLADMFNLMRSYCILLYYCEHGGVDLMGLKPDP